LPPIAQWMVGKLSGIQVFVSSGCFMAGYCRTAIGSTRPGAVSRDYPNWTFASMKPAICLVMSVWLHCAGDNDAASSGLLARRPSGASETVLGGRRKQRRECSIFRRVCMRGDPLCMLACASCDVKLPLPGLPALKRCPFCFRLHRPGVGRDDCWHAEDIRGSCRQWHARDTQLLFRLWLSSIHSRRSCSGGDVHPFLYVGQSVGVSADAGYLDI
jgi:hypothetical protein